MSSPRILQMHRTQVLNEALAEMRLSAVIYVDFVKALIRDYWKQECGDAMAELKRIDPLGWERWYDMEIVDGHYREITTQVRQRIEVLKRLRNPSPLDQLTEASSLENRRDEILAHYGESDNHAELDSELADIQAQLNTNYGAISDREWANYR